jgi:hypothetical protein
MLLNLVVLPQQIRMDGDMLTEDIDSSFRASLLPVKICYCYQASIWTVLADMSSRSHLRLFMGRG